MCRLPVGDRNGVVEFSGLDGPRHRPPLDGSSRSRWRAVHWECVEPRWTSEFWPYRVEVRALMRGGPEWWAGRAWYSPAVHAALVEVHGRMSARRMALDARRIPRPPRRKKIPRSTPEARRISARTRSLVFERDGFRCRRCGAPAPEVRLVLDHVVPVALSGTGEMTNLQTLCVTCNAGKSDRAPHAHDLRTQEQTHVA